MSDRRTLANEKPAAQCAAGCVWPRLPDHVITRAVGSIPANGEPVIIGDQAMVVFALGTFSGVEASNKPTTGVNFFDLNTARGVPLPGKFRWRTTTGASGSVLLLGWDLLGGESLEDLAALAAAIASASASSSAAQQPNRATVARVAVAGGVFSHSWTQAGFINALLLFGPGNAGTLTIGTTFGPLAAGSSIDNFVGQTATGFTGTGTVNGDQIEILEFGRV